MKQLNLLCFLLFISLRVISMPCMGCSGNVTTAPVNSNESISHKLLNLYQISLLSAVVTIEESQEDDSEPKLLINSAAYTNLSFFFSPFFSHQVQTLLSTQAISKTNKRLFTRFQNLRI